MARTFPSPLWGEGQGEGKCEHGAKIWRRGGLTRLRSPYGQPVRCASGLSNWLRQLSNPGRGFSSPRSVHDIRKEPVQKYELFSKYGGEGRIDSLALALWAARPLRVRSVQLASPVVEPRSGVLIPPVRARHTKRARTQVRALL